MSTHIHNPGLEMADAFWREYIYRRQEFEEWRVLYEAILERTRNPLDSAELLDLFPDTDERVLRRRVADLRTVLQDIANKEGLPYFPSITESKSGRVANDEKTKRHTFYLKQNEELPDFYKRKWWSGMFPNKPGANCSKVFMVYGTVETHGSNGDRPRIYTSHGDFQMVKTFTRDFDRNGVDCEDMEANGCKFHPDESDRSLVLIGNRESNDIMDTIEFPKVLALRFDSNGVLTDGTAAHRWAYQQAEGPILAYGLISVFPCSMNPEARAYVFEAQHDRVLEAIAKEFSVEENLARLATDLNVRSTDEFPCPLQLVFSVKMNKTHQLIGSPQLVYASHRLAPKVDPPGTPARPMNVQERKIIGIKERRRA